MSFFPYHSYTLKSTKDANAVKQTIRTFIEPVQSVRNMYDRSQYLPFEGVMKVDTFKVQRIHGFRKPFFPFTYGRLIATDEGTTLKITTRLNFYVYFIIGFWLLIFSTFTVPFLIDGYTGSGIATGVLSVGVTFMLIYSFHKDDVETKNLMQRAMSS